MNDRPKPQFKHDCEVSLVPVVGKCHFLGRTTDGDSQPYDLYIHAREAGGGLTELLARYGDEGADYMSSAVEHLRLRPVGYCLTLAWQAAEAAGYDLAGMAKLDEHDLQAYEDRLMDAGDPYAGTGMVDEGLDTLD